MSIMKDIIESAIKEHFKFILQGSQYTGISKEGMKQGNKIILNKKLHIYKRTTEFSLRAIIISILMFLLLEKVLYSNIISLHDTVLGEPADGFTLRTSMAFAVIAVSLVLSMYQAKYFKRGLYGYKKSDFKKMVKCSFEPVMITFLGCSIPMTVYIWKKSIICSYLLLCVLMFIVLIGILLKRLRIHKYTVYESDIKNIDNPDGLNIKKDVRIVYRNKRKRHIDLTKYMLMINDVDDILVIDLTDEFAEFDDETEPYVYKNKVDYIDLGGVKIRYKDSRWIKAEE